MVDMPEAAVNLAVAPLAGAWVEIAEQLQLFGAGKGRSPRGGVG